MSTATGTLQAKTSRHLSLMIYLALILFLALVKVIIDLAGVETITPGQASAFTWPVIGLLAIVGGLAVWLGPRTRLPALWDQKNPPQRWILLPVLVGLGVGGVNLAIQGLTGTVHTLAEAANIRAISVPFPESILFYSAGAIVVESVYRLIVITLPIWLIAHVILRRRGYASVFWVMAALSSLLEPTEMLSLMSGHPAVMVFVAVSLYVANLFEAVLFWRYGFLAPLAFRVAFYLIWHGVGSLFGF